MMKVSIILTSLVVAMSAMSLTACDYASETDATAQSPDATEKAEAMKNEATEVIKPDAPVE